MRVILFEDERWSRFAPLVRMRHLSLLMFGTSTLLDHAKRGLAKRGDDDELILSGRSYIAATTRERIGLVFRDEGERADEDTLMVNSSSKQRSAVGTADHMRCPGRSRRPLALT